MTDQALLTPDDMATRLGVPKSTVMQWNREHSWPHVRLGRRYRWTEEQYDTIVRQHVHVGGHGVAPSTSGLTRRSAARRRSA